VSSIAVPRWLAIGRASGCRSRMPEGEPRGARRPPGSSERQWSQQHPRSTWRFSRRRSTGPARCGIADAAS
jgi:hypothetical protein